MRVAVVPRAGHPAYGSQVDLRLIVREGASLPGVAINVDEHTVVKVVNNVLSPREVRVSNTGPDSVTLSKNPAVTAGQGVVAVLNAVTTVWLSAGEAVYAITATGKTAALQVL